VRVLGQLHVQLLCSLQLPPELAAAKQGKPPAAAKQVKPPAGAEISRQPFMGHNPTEQHDEAQQQDQDVKEGIGLAAAAAAAAAVGGAASDSRVTSNSETAAPAAAAAAAAAGTEGNVATMVRASLKANTMQ
jgi:hypothetical protein